MLTPIDKFGDIFVKREDLANWSSLDYPSGSKVRQYFDMAGMVETSYGKGIKLNHLNEDMSVPPCLVGCSANSAMQIYVAATAKLLGTQGIIYTAKRKVRSDATLYAERMGAEIVEIKPGYLSYIRKEARQRAINLKKIVMWDRHKAIEDTIEQCKNIPNGVKRIIVPTGSGLTAAGVLIGCPSLEVVAVCVSPMADSFSIVKLAKSAGLSRVSGGRLHVIAPSIEYDRPVVAQLPDGTPLDPFYAAKAWQYMQAHDCLWPPGLRPVCSMPEVCREQFKNWKGPK